MRFHKLSNINKNVKLIENSDNDIGYKTSIPIHSGKFRCKNSVKCVSGNKMFLSHASKDMRKACSHVYTKTYYQILIMCPAAI